MASPNPKATKLNIGCGPDIRSTFEGWDNIDRWEYEDWVVPIDLELGKLPYGDNSIDEIRATHVLEHIYNYVEIMNECWRVLKKTGIIYIEVPMFPHPDSVKDPTHVRFFVPETFKYFSGYLTDGLFKMYQIRPWIEKGMNVTADTSTISVTMSPKKD